MNTDNFVWNDELVKEFANNLDLDVMANNHDIEKFKQSKQPPISKDYEILTCFDNEIKEWKDGKDWHDYIPKADKLYITSCESDKCNIRSVRRINDGEVFTVGDKVQYTHESKLNDQPTRRIEKFTIHDGELFINKHYVGQPQTRICHWQKPAKPPLGLLPKHIWEEQRIADISEAIERYKEAGKEIPQEWINEQYDLGKRIKIHKASSQEEMPFDLNDEKILSYSDVWEIIEGVNSLNINSNNKGYLHFHFYSEIKDKLCPKP